MPYQQKIPGTKVTYQHTGRKRLGLHVCRKQIDLIDVAVHLDALWKFRNIPGDQVTVRCKQTIKINMAQVTLNTFVNFIG